MRDKVIETGKRILNYINIYSRLWFTKPNTRQGLSILLIGPTSSGTRMLTRFLIGCGCYGQGEHKQVLDYENPDYMYDKIVWRRSVPHEMIMGSLLKPISLLLEKMGYDVKIIIIHRNKEVTLKSMLKHNLADNIEHAKIKLRNANLAIDKFTSETKFPCRFFSYEKFVTDKAFREKVAFIHGLEYIELEKYENMNLRYDK